MLYDSHAYVQDDRHTPQASTYHGTSIQGKHETETDARNRVRKADRTSEGKAVVNRDACFGVIPTATRRHSTLRVATPRPRSPSGKLSCSHTVHRPFFERPIEIIVEYSVWAFC